MAERELDKITVGELIKILESFPEDDVIGVYGRDGFITLAEKVRLIEMPFKFKGLVGKARHVIAISWKGPFE